LTEEEIVAQRKEPEQGVEVVDEEYLPKEMQKMLRFCRVMILYIVQMLLVLLQYPL